jgi:carbon-monoxide dehydrogenase medium subunit
VHYYEPNFLNEALVLLDRYGSRARVLAGGTLLGPQLRSDDAAVDALVNVKRIAELRRVTIAGDALHIGALLTASELAQDSLVRKHAPLIAEAARSMGAPQLRNVATLGGNVLSRDPAADLATALLALDAGCIVTSLSDDECEIPLADMLAPQAPALAPGALLSAVRIPAHSGRWAYHKMTRRRAFEMAVVAAAVCCELTGDVVVRARIALAGAAAAPIRAKSAEAALTNIRLTRAAAAGAAAKAAALDAGRLNDKRASAAYRRQLVSVLTRRALLDVAGEQPTRVTR